MTETVKRDLIDLSPPPVSGEDNVANDASPKAELTLPPEEVSRITDDVVEAMKTVFDPEIPVDIYELGLIYKVDLEDDKTLNIDMTLTAPGCPVAGEMPIWVRDATCSISRIRAPTHACEKRSPSNSGYRSGWASSCTTWTDSSSTSSASTSGMVIA